jgi:hypothetical protein
VLLLHEKIILPSEELFFYFKNSKILSPIKSIYFLTFFSSNSIKLASTSSFVSSVAKFPLVTSISEEEIFETKFVAEK